MIDKIKIYTEYLIVFLMIATSGSAYFFAVNGKYTIIMLLTICILYNIFYNKMLKKNIIILISLFILLFTHYIIHINDSIRNIDFIIILLNISIMFCVANVLTFSKYKKNYVNIMYIFSVLSIIIFALSFIIPIDYFPLLSKEGILVYSPYHMFYWQSDVWIGQIGRNSGIFTEPGLYAGNLVIAIIFCINIYKNNEKKYKRYLFILIITLITTKSTIGYICLILLLPYVFKLFINSIEIYKSKNITYFILTCSVIIILMICVLIINSPTVIDKFNISNASFNDRSKDLIKGIEILMINPIKGLGYYSELTNTIEYEYGIGQNTLGLLYFTYMLGIPIVLYLLTLIFKSIYNENRNINFFILIIVILLNLFTQPLLIMPTYMIFMFKFKNNEYM